MIELDSPLLAPIAIIGNRLQRVPQQEVYLPELEVQHILGRQPLTVLQLIKQREIICGVAAGQAGPRHSCKRGADLRRRPIRHCRFFRCTHP